MTPAETRRTTAAADGQARDEEGKKLTFDDILIDAGAGDPAAGALAVPLDSTFFNDARADVMAYAAAPCYAAEIKMKSDYDPHRRRASGDLDPPSPRRSYSATAPTSRSRIWLPGISFCRRARSCRGDRNASSRRSFLIAALQQRMGNPRP